MPRMVVTRTIDAPQDRVFHTVADIAHFSDAIPEIVKVEFLSDKKRGVGTRFRETRLMNGKEVSTELEVTEYVPNERVRLVAPSHGTVWDTVFVVTPAANQSTLTMTMDYRSERLIPKVMTLLISPMVKSAIAKDMDRVKAYCEAQPQSPRGAA